MYLLFDTQGHGCDSDIRMEGMFSIVNCFHNVQVLLLHFTLTWSTMWISCQLGNHALAARTSIPQSCKGCNIRPFYCVKKTRGKKQAHAPSTASHIFSLRILAYHLGWCTSLRCAMLVRFCTCLAWKAWEKLILFVRSLWAMGDNDWALHKNKICACENWQSDLKVT